MATALAELDDQLAIIDQEIAKAYSTIEALATVRRGIEAKRLPLLAQAAARLPRFAPHTTTDRKPAQAVPALASRS